MESGNTVVAIEVDHVHAGWPMFFYDGYRGYSSDGRGQPQTVVFSKGPGGMSIVALMVDAFIAVIISMMAVIHVEKLNWK